MTGDLVSGFVWDRSDTNYDFWANYALIFAGMMKTLNVPWGFVPGDHDFEADAD